MHGENPLYYHGGIEKDYSRLVEKFIKPAIRAGKLTPQATSPYDWIQWAISKGLGIPDRLTLFVNEQSGLAQETLKVAAAKSQHPGRLYPQAFRSNISAAKLREKWKVFDNGYLEEIAGRGELVPFDNSRMQIQVKRNGLGYQFGIHHDIEWSDGGSAVWDDTNITWMDTLPDDVVYELPDVLAYEDLYPALKQNAKASPEDVTPSLDASKEAESPTKAMGNAQQSTNGDFTDEENTHNIPPITPIAKPKNKDDWFEAIRDCAKEFEMEFQRTPSPTELWTRLIENPPVVYGIKWDLKKKALGMGGKKLDRDAFGKRHKRYWPTHPFYHPQ